MRKLLTFFFPCLFFFFFEEKKLLVFCLGIRKMELEGFYTNNFCVCHSCYDEVSEIHSHRFNYAMGLKVPKR